MEVHIVSGFLGAGKTTFLNQYLPLLSGKTVVIENEFGDVGLDGELIRGDIPVREIYAGCICCSLAMDFRQGIKDVAETLKPDQIVIEPSGVGRLSDIIKACNKTKEKDAIDLTITKLIAIVDIASFEEYEEGFGTFYLDQIRHARLLLLSNLDEISQEKRKIIVKRIQRENPQAILYKEDFRKLTPRDLKELLDRTEDYDSDSDRMSVPALPADRIFSSIAIHNPTQKTEEELAILLEKLKKAKYGQVLRAKGMIQTPNNEILHFNYTASSTDYEEVGITEENRKDTKVIIIGCELNELALKTLFG
ncbi:MAG: GTP-binding protein [Lachnospiraceae bacterium]